MFDIFDGQTNVDKFDFKTALGRTVDVKTGFRRIHTRLLVNLQQFNGDPKDCYVAVKVFAEDTDVKYKLVDWDRIFFAQIMGYSEYEDLKNADIANFGEGDAKFIPYNELRDIDVLLDEF